MENNMFKMFSEVSNKLNASNPELSKVFNQMVTGKLNVNSGKEMQELLIKMHPNKKKEIEKNFDCKAMDEKLSKLNDALSMINNFNFTK